MEIYTQKRLGQQKRVSILARCNSKKHTSEQTMDSAGDFGIDQQEHARGAYLIQTKQYKGAHAGIEQLEPVA